VREGGRLRQELRGHVDSHGQPVDRLDPGRGRGIDEVLPLDDEQPELVAPAPVAELADELEPLVVARGDQA
jgi:hypothetical protein